MKPKAVVLADSSFYIGEIRQGRDPLRQLRLLSDSREIAICGAVCCEVGRGIRDPSFRAKYHKAWAEMLYLPTDQQVWAESENLLWTLARRGRQIPLTDAVIACCALRADAVVLSEDSHFREVPGLSVAESIRALLLRS